MDKIIKSRNQREGHYAGWRVTLGRGCINRNGAPVRHERSGGGEWKKSAPLSYWSKA